MSPLQVSASIIHHNTYYNNVIPASRQGGPSGFVSFIANPERVKGLLNNGFGEELQKP